MTEDPCPRMTGRLHRRWPSSRTLSIVAAMQVCAVAPGVAMPSQDGTIVVLAPKLRDWRAVLVVGAGDKLRCRIVRSTGDAALDAMACAAQKRCFEIARPAIIAATTKPAAVRKRLMKAIDRDLTTCFATVSARFDTYPLDGEAVAPDGP